MGVKQALEKKKDNGTYFKFQFVLFPPLCYKLVKKLSRIDFFARLWAWPKFATFLKSDVFLCSERPKQAIKIGKSQRTLFLDSVRSIAT